MNHKNRARSGPIVTYRPRLATNEMKPYSEIEKACLDVICVRDARIMVLEFAIRQACLVLEERPSEVNEARRILEATLAEGED